MKEKKLSPGQKKFLSTMGETSTLSHNLQSLLKDLVVNDDDLSEDIFVSPPSVVKLHDLAQTKLRKELNSLYEEYSFVTAKDASLRDDLRRSAGNTHSEDSLVYGEIDLGGFCDLLQSLSTTGSNGVFYDLGSGSGRAVFAARFAGDYERCVGIELLSNLHDLASSVKSLYKFQYQSKLKWTTVEFVHSDLLEHDWSDGSVVYAPSLLFDSPMMERIAEKALSLQSDAYLVSLKQFADTLEAFNQAFKLIEYRPVLMSWGNSNVYVYQRNGR
eukprot:CAMPEP_0113441700 /NCGR_PEP_ID=MMETSP0014_2-20120614/1219_1 /TAXON_ID=2857 /ORGANISM="Nitzschia sp." /LENGTH=271 /DNA_ID=CAMNT_0000332555 /DNA_START=52 /DNA_END=867 /DNA_ORIENTATION=- /assembly_acc=CAM_ASM_000159